MNEKKPIIAWTVVRVAPGLRDDGCCTNYGTITKVNGQELELHNQDTATILRQVLEYLGYEVEINEKYSE